MKTKIFFFENLFWFRLVWLVATILCIFFGNPQVAWIWPFIWIFIVVGGGLVVSPETFFTKPDFLPRGAEVISCPHRVKTVCLRGRYGLYTDYDKQLTDIIYDELVFDDASDCYLGKVGKNTHLISTEGKVLFKTTLLDLSFLGPGIEISQELVSRNDGTFLYLSRNTLTGSGWENIVDKEGKIISEFKLFFSV